MGIIDSNVTIDHLRIENEHLEAFRVENSKLTLSNSLIDNIT